MIARRQPRRRGHGLLSVCAVLSAACGEDPSAGACGEHDCTLPADRAELLQQLDGFADPVALWLREAANDAGDVPGDHEDWLAGLRGVLGCDAADERSFVVLSNAAFAPKAIVTQCATDPVAASRLFAVFEPGAGEDTLDGERFRLAAWDPDAAAFHRYQVAPRGQGLTVAVEPEFCGSCHGGPFAIEAWTPIMNEMTNPWAQWNAEPGFESFAFHENFPAGAGGPVYDALTREGRLDSASNLEPIVRAAIDRTTAARIATRSAAPTLDGAAALVRPVFCDENANYVSEVHDSGELLQTAVLDPGLRRALAQLEPDADWDFTRDEVLTLPPPQQGGAMVMIAVRGELTVQAEAALLSRGVLAPIDVLRVRALDWTHPFDSALRCQLWRDAVARAEAGALVPADFADDAALARALFDEALRVAPGASLADVGDDVVALDDAADAAATAAVLAGDFTAARSSPRALGDRIDAAVAALASPQGRDAIERERIRRGCAARLLFPIAPIVPGTETCS